MLVAPRLEGTVAQAEPRPRTRQPDANDASRRRLGDDERQALRRELRDRQASSDHADTAREVSKAEERGRLSADERERLRKQLREANGRRN